MTAPAEPAISPYTSEELDETGAAIEAVQLPSGFIPWKPDGHGDPWNHVEALMALGALGRIAAAERGFAWLERHQAADGSWHAYYRCDGSVEQRRRDTNAVAYIATGVWHHYLVTRDRTFLESMWPVVARAVDFVVSWQRPGGGFTWAVDPDGTPGPFALRAASSSVCSSLQAAAHCATTLGVAQPGLLDAAETCRTALRTAPGEFATKDEFAMDWYYPVLAGALTGDGARARLDADWSRFVVSGHGVRCRSDGAWVTTAETAECAIAHVVAGRADRAAQLLSWTRLHRLDGGAYLTGVVSTTGVSFPTGETTTYSAAAVVLASALLSGAGALAGLFGPPSGAITNNGGAAAP